MVSTRESVGPHVPTSHPRGPDPWAGGTLKAGSTHVQISGEYMLEEGYQGTLQGTEQANPQ